MKVTVSDMTCQHCVAKIQKALIINGIVAKVDLKDHSVTFDKDKDLDKAKKAIEDAGYTVTL